MQNFNPIVLQSLLRNLQIQQYNPQLDLYNQLAYAPMSPEQQAWANNLKRTDPTLQNTNLNYIPTIQQLNLMNAFNARGLTTEDREQMRATREAYDNLMNNNQGQ